MEHVIVNDKIEINKTNVTSESSFNDISNLNFKKDEIDFSIFENDDVKHVKTESITGDDKSTKKTEEINLNENNNYNTTLSDKDLQEILLKKAKEKYPYPENCDQNTKKLIQQKRSKWKKKEFDNTKDEKLEKNSEMMFDNSDKITSSSISVEKKDEKTIKKEELKKVSEDTLENLYTQIRNHQIVMNYNVMTDEELKKFTKDELINSVKILDKKSSIKANEIINSGPNQLILFGFQVIENNAEFLANKNGYSLKGLTENAIKHQKELMQSSAEVLVEVFPEIFPYMESKKIKFGFKLFQIFGETLTENRKNLDPIIIQPKDTSNENK